MTREESIKELERAFDVLDHSCHMDNRRKEAFNMARVALSTEPCEDVVALEFSADIDKPSKYQTKDGKWHDGKIPSVTPKQKVSENPTGSTCSEKPNNCEDAISFPKGTLKKRGKGYVVYNPEWLKENWQTELKLMGVECEDTISRADAEALFRNARSKLNPSDYKTADEFNTRDLMMLNAEQFIHLLPSVTPKQKMGRCKDCKHFEYDSVAKVDGIPLIVAHEICKKWGDGCKTREDGYCFLFEPLERSDKE